MTVHILGGGVGYYIHAEFEGAAVYGGGKGVVNNQGNAVTVGKTGKFLKIKHGAGGVGDGLTENRLGVGFKIFCKLLFGKGLVNEGAFDAHFLHCNTEEVVGTAVDGGGGNEMVARLADVEDGIEVGCLTRRGQHSGNTALHCADFCGNSIVGGVLQTGVEIALGFKVEKLSHIVAGVVFKGRALINGELSGFALLRSIAFVYASGFDFHIICPPIS